MAIIHCVKCLFVSLLFFNIARAHSDEMCIPVRGTESGNPPPEVHQGRPGKIGPKGGRSVKGAQGIQGLPGQCACELSEVEELRSEIRLLNDSLKRLKIFDYPKARVSVCSVGIKYGIFSNHMTASSTDNTHSAQYGRLDNIRGRFNGGCWIPSTSKWRTAGEWIQVDLYVPTYIVGVVTQGRQDYDFSVGNCAWVTSYTIQYGNTTLYLPTIQRNNANLVFSGNRDRSSYVINNFPEPIKARYFRLVVMTWNYRIGLRMDLLTC